MFRRLRPNATITVRVWQVYRPAFFLRTQIPAETPAEHIHAAVAACHTYGQYPIAENLDKIPLELPERESLTEFLQDKGETIDA